MDTTTSVPSTVGRMAYRTQQLSMLLPCLAANGLMLSSVGRFRHPVAAVREASTRYRALLDRDLANVDACYYPKSLLFRVPIRDYVRRLPAFVGELPGARRRRLQGDFLDLPTDVDVERFPDYYRRNFHWQRDGYLSDASAELYDLSVELLFVGTADVMRRQVIPPVTRFARDHGPELRLLDVGCGTGRLLGQLAVAHPGMRYVGLDLSPFYLETARGRLRAVRTLDLVADKAEAMPFPDGAFDVVTSAYLFHELPHGVRREVLREAWRVLRPGGLLVVEDSAQLVESTAMGHWLDLFASEFHEPFHAEYVRDDLASAFGALGFRVESAEPHFLSKVVVARKALSS